MKQNKVDEIGLHEAIKKLAQIADIRCIKPEMRMTAGMYIEAEQELNRRKYVESLEEKITLLNQALSQQKEEIIEMIDDEAKKCAEIKTNSGDAQYEILRSLIDKIKNK